MDNPPLVSILIPCFNAEPFLKECLENVLAQAYPALEIIAYDDGSIDKTWEILQQFNPKIQSFRSPSNSGASKARNFLLNKSRGDYIHFQDADDLMHPRFVELMLPWFLIGEYKAVLCNVDYFIENDPQNLQGGWYVRPRFFGEDWLAYILQVGGQTINSLYEREALFRIEGFRETITFVEDYDLHIRLAEAGFRFATVGQSLIKKRKKPETLSLILENKTLIAAYKVIIDSWKRLGISRKEVPDEVRIAFAQRLWEIGRLLTQIGEHRYAVESIRLSKKIGNPRQIPGSFLYRALIKILGILLVERIRFYWYKLRKKWRP